MGVAEDQQAFEERNDDSIEVALSTSDNPWDPFEDFDEWFAEDIRLGHNTCGLLARVCVTSDELSVANQSYALRDAIDEIVQMNISGVHIKVVRKKHN